MLQPVAATPVKKLNIDDNDDRIHIVITALVMLTIFKEIMVPILRSVNEMLLIVSNYPKWRPK